MQELEKVEVSECNDEKNENDRIDSDLSMQNEKAQKKKDESVQCYVEKVTKEYVN